MYRNKLLCLTLAVLLALPVLPTALAAETSATETETTGAATEPAETAAAETAAAETAPESVEAETSSAEATAATETTPSTVPETVPETTSETVPETTPETVPEETPPTSCTVVFDPCGGSCSVSRAVTTPGGFVEALPIPVREEHVFLGWFREEFDSEEFDTATPVDSDITVYAHWARIQNRGTRILFDPCGGTLPQPILQATAQAVNAHSQLSVYDWSGQQVEPDDLCRMAKVNDHGLVSGTCCPYIPENGLLVVGRYDPAAGTPTPGSAFAESIQTENYIGFDYETRLITLYDSRDGYLAGNKYVTFGSPWGDLPTPTREGFTFTGWYTAPLGGKAVTRDTIASPDVTTLYAHWGSACKHEYTMERRDATCQTPAALCYSCTLCGVAMELPAGSGWSDSVTQVPHGTPEGLVRTQAEYRFRCLEETTAASHTLPGWTAGDAVPAWGEYGPWSEWSLTPAQQSDAVQVETALLYRYHRFLCETCKASNPWPGACGCSASGSVWQELWSPIPYSGSEAVPCSRAYRSTTALGDGGQWFFAAGNESDDVLGTPDALGETSVIRLGFRSRTRSMVNLRHFFRYGDWSEWTQTAVPSSAQVDVQCRTVYQIYTGPLAEHTFQEGVCSVCGKKE